MAAPDARDLADALEERRSAQYYVDAWRGRRTSYSEFHERLNDTYAVYNGDWSVIWPDGETTEALPKIANIVQIAADDRARAVASLVPSILRRPQRPGDKARAEADKVERIVSDWLRRSRVWGHMTQRWALDAMAGGLMVAKIDMDTSLPKEMRYPCIKHIHPARCFPDPVFAPGPGVNNMIVSYVEKLRVLKERFPDADLGPFFKDPNVSSEEGTVIEFHDDTYSVVVVSAINKGYNPNKTGKHVELANIEHGLGCTPFAIGTRPTMTGEYRGEFYGSFGVLNFANRLRTLMLDDAIAKVYPERLTYNVENPEQMGPGADHELQTPDARYEYVQQPNQPFSNLQIMRDLMSEARSGVILPPARSGDPNESIISAAGIGAANSQFVEDVRSIQRDMLAPMLEHAVCVAAKWDLAYGDVEKPIHAAHGNYVENYMPSKALPEHLNVEVRYGMGAGLDEINTNVMVLQQWAGGNGLISRRTAQEQSPFVEDPQREEKQQLLEQLNEATKAGLLAQAANGTMTAETLAMIAKAVEKDGVSLTDAIAQVAPLAPAPLAAPAASPGASPSAAPGLAGAAAPQNSQQQLPPIEELFGQAV